MSPTDEHEGESRQEKLDETVDKAKQGAKKLAGWLGQRLNQAAEQVKGSQIVREQMDKLDRFKDDATNTRLQGNLASVYDDWMSDLSRAVEGMEANIAALERSCEDVQYNINSLRLRGVGEQDDEMQEYHGHTKAMRAEIHELQLTISPFKEESDRLSRHRRAAIARLQADPSLVSTLQQEARRHVAESRSRLSALADPTNEAPETE